MWEGGILRDMQREILAVPDPRNPSLGEASSMHIHSTCDICMLELSVEECTIPKRRA